jgi:hypothetical protein
VENPQKVKNRPLREPKARLRKAKSLPIRISPKRNSVRRPAYRAGAKAIIPKIILGLQNPASLLIDPSVSLAGERTENPFEQYEKGSARFRPEFLDAIAPHFRHIDIP